MSKELAMFLWKTTGSFHISGALLKMREDINDRDLMLNHKILPMALIRLFQIFGFTSENIINFFNENFTGTEKDVLCDYLTENIEVLRIMDDGKNSSTTEKYNRIKDDESKIIIFTMIFYYMWELQTGINLKKAVKEKQISDYSGYCEKMNHWKEVFKDKFRCEVLLYIQISYEFIMKPAANFLPVGNILIIDDRGDKNKICKTNYNKLSNNFPILTISNYNENYCYYENNEFHEIYNEVIGTIDDNAYNFGKEGNCALISFVRFVQILNKDYNEITNLINRLDERFNGMIERLQPIIEPLVDKIVNRIITLENIESELGDLEVDHNETSVYNQICNFEYIFQYIFTKINTEYYFSQMNNNKNRQISYIPKANLEGASRYINEVIKDYISSNPSEEKRLDIQIPLFTPVYFSNDNYIIDKDWHASLEVYDNKTGNMILEDPNFNELLVHKKMHPFYFNFTMNYSALYYKLDSNDYVDNKKYVAPIRNFEPENEQTFPVPKPTKEFNVEELTEEETELRNKLLENDFFKLVPPDWYEILSKQHPDVLQEILNDDLIKNGQYFDYLAYGKKWQQLTNNDRYVDYISFEPVKEISKNSEGRKLTSDEIEEQNRLLTTHPLFAQIPDSEVTLREYLEKTHPDKLKEYIAKNMDLSDDDGINANYIEIMENAIYDK